MKMPNVIGRLLLAVVLSATATQAQRAPDPVTTDPAVRDTAFPAGIAELALASHGARMNALMYVAQGAGPHPVVVLLHGYPGNERNLDLAQALRRAGVNVLFFSYRGAWGSGGTFSFANAQEDVAAALRYVRAAQVARTYRVDTTRIALIGHSMGGWLALLGAAADPGVTCVGGIEYADMVLNYARRRTDVATDSAQRAYAEWLTAPGGPLRGDPKSMMAALASHPDWSILRHVPALTLRPVLLLDNDLNTNHDELVAALHAAGARQVTAEVWPTDHSFSDRRVALAQAVVRWATTACGF